MMPAQRLRDIDEILNPRLNLPEGSPGLRVALDRWRHRQLQALDLVWRTEGDTLVANVDHGSFIIRPAPDGDHCLLFVWARGDQSLLHLGAPADLRRQASDLIIRGGPFGGPLADPLYAPPRICAWIDSQEPDQARVQAYGWGHTFRHRPVGDRRYLVLVAPSGAFTLGGSGQVDDVGSIAGDMRHAISPFSRELRARDRPFYVRVDGLPLRLRYTACPAFMGYQGWPRDTHAVEVFLVLLGANDLAVVRVIDDEIRVVARGPGDTLRGTEIFPEGKVTSPQHLVIAPTSMAPEAVAEAVMHLRCVAPLMREHMANLARQATGKTGMRSARELLWLVAVAHERGYRREISGRLPLVLKELSKAAGFEVKPCERALRPALTWLHRNSPLVRPLNGPPNRWEFRVDLLSEPDLAMVEWFAQQGRS